MTKYFKPKKISEKDPLTDEDLDCAIEILIEASKMMANKALMATIQDYADKKTTQIDSLKKLRQVADVIRSKDE